MAFAQVLSSASNEDSLSIYSACLRTVIAGLSFIPYAFIPC